MRIERDLWRALMPFKRGYHELSRISSVQSRHSIFRNSTHLQLNLDPRSEGGCVCALPMALALKAFCGRRVAIGWDKEVDSRSSPQSRPPRGMNTPLALDSSPRRGAFGFELD